MLNRQPVNSLKGIGEKTGKLFEKLGVVTVDDLLSYYPRAYDAYEPPVSIGQLKEQAVMALEAYPQGLQVGGGITADNAMEFIDAGAAAVIVTSYVFKDGRINYANLNRLKDTVGSDRLVLDLSCRKKDGQYYIVTDRWQNFTDEAVTTELLDKLSSYCCEFLVHAVDVEGRVNGIEKELVAMLGSWGRIPVTYAGGVSSFDDLKCIRQLGQNHLNVTIGSALDLFGGEMEYDKVIAFCNNKEI